MQCESVDTGIQFIGQQAINLLVALHLSLPLKGTGDNHQLEVGLRIGWHGMHVALINHFKMIRAKCPVYFVFNCLLNAHRYLFRTTSTANQRDHNTGGYRRADHPCHIRTHGMHQQVIVGVRLQSQFIGNPRSHRYC